MTMMTTCCVLVCGLNSLVDYSNVKTHDIWMGKCDNEEGILVENVCFLWFRHVREDVT